MISGSHVPSPSVEALAISLATQSSADISVTKDSNTPSNSTPLKEYHRLPPVKVDSSKKWTKWTIPTPSDHIEGTLYDIVLGVSIKDLTIDPALSILFRYDQLSLAGGGSFESEVINISEIKRMTFVDVSEMNECSKIQKEDGIEEAEANKPDDEEIIIFKWMMRTPYYGGEDGVAITMDISTWLEAPLEYGSLGLHFVELCRDAAKVYKTDPLFKEHIPYCSWAIDANRGGCSEYDTRMKKQAFIENFSFSGDGRFAVIRTIAGEEGCLEVWSLEDCDVPNIEPNSHNGIKGINSQKGNEYIKTFKEGRSTLKTQKNVNLGCLEERAPKKPYHATPIAWIPLPAGNFDVSISWDGSQVALLDKKKLKSKTDQTEVSSTVYKSQFAIFRFGQDGYAASEKSPSKRSLVRYNVQQTCPQLKNFTGHGIFHMVDWSNPDLEGELFVTCNGITIEVYRADGDWGQTHSILMDSNITRSMDAPGIGNALLRNLRGRYFVVGNEISTLFTFDIVSGGQVSFTSAVSREELRLINYASCVSEDGAWIAIADFRHFSIYWTKTWTLCGRYKFQGLASDDRVVNLASLYNGACLCVTVGSSNSLARQTRPVYIIDFRTLVIIDRLALNGGIMPIPIPYTGYEQHSISQTSTKLSRISIKDWNYPSPSVYPLPCDKECFTVDTKVNEVKSGISRSGLHFNIQKMKACTGSHHKHDKRSTLSVTMSDPIKGQTKRMVIPLPDGVTIKMATFLHDFRYLVVITSIVHMTWTTPTIHDEEFRLQNAFAWGLVSSFSICPHGNTFLRQVLNKKIEFAGGVAHSMSLQLSQPFFYGLTPMLRIYELSDPVLRQTIVRYYGKYLNTYFKINDHHENILFHFSSLWGTGFNRYTGDFLRDLLFYSGYNWVPQPDTSIRYNPLNKFIEWVDETPSAIKMVETIVDYCISRAKAENDLVLLDPIRQCLPTLLDPKKSYSDIALKVYREIAFFPVQGQEFIIQHFALASPVSSRWTLKGCPWGLHQDKDQVMQLELEKVPNPPEGPFTREIFQASFDFLWRRTNGEEAPKKPKKRHAVKELFSWPIAIWTMILRKCRLRYIATIECHPFEHEVLDNPALIAMVEFKWNTIGFYYWLVRFLGQLLYYTLVIMAVFFQIYGNTRIEEVQVTPDEIQNNLVIDLGPMGLFVAIIPIALLFLWLEFIQFLKDRRGYFRSIYNIVDLLAFILPLAGAIDQILAIYGVNKPEGNSSLLSFSVLIIFLHFLFALRVFQLMCHFVSIIIRAIYSIRIFFFVFGAGLLAFSIAILHLLYACIDPVHCKYYNENFSHSLLRSLSMTYFMLGGNYDQIGDGFTSNSIAFHLMMMLFFFFSVILMLNVLIALVNGAINDGDITWRLDWLEYRMGYVESAENMSYEVPGFRDNHKYFPDTIYYTNTALKVREYTKATKELYEKLKKDGAHTALSNALSAGAELSFAVDVLIVEEKGFIPTNATVTATTAAAVAEVASVTTHAGAHKDPVMAMLKKQHEDQASRDEEQRKRYEEQQKQNDEHMRLLAEQSRRLEQQHQAMVEMQSELRLLKERS
ncbi:hypothetical protein FBU30_009848 [Linnemannia zychae]|nr:hypothetical protein FBU30_009848 [Linnemannia zychae]